MRQISNSIFNSFFRVITVVLFVPVLWVIEPFWRFRFSTACHDRIGHLAADLEVYSRDLELSGGLPARTTHVFIAWRPANQQLLTMWKRHLLIIQNYLASKVFIAALPILKTTRFYNNHRLHSQALDVLANGEPTLFFTEEEIIRGQEELQTMGIGPNDWWVCFHSRDVSYLSFRTSTGQASRDLPASIRDCSIENYIPAMKWVVEQGGYAIRMGSIVEQPLPNDLHANIIDYTTQYRSDFMDIYLLAKCRFFCGNTSGPYMVSAIFGKPVIVANSTPLCGREAGPQTYILPKLIRKSGGTENLTFNECHLLNLFHAPSFSARRLLIMADFYSSRQLELHETPAEDIVDACQDIQNILADKPHPEESKIIPLQVRFRTLQDHPYSAPLSSSFALKYKNLIND